MGPGPPAAGRASPAASTGRQLAREIEAVRGHPAYRALDDVPGRRRELEFIHLGVSRTASSRARSTSPPRRAAGIAALDVKTGGGDAEALKRKADGYALQRSVYVGALEAIGGRPVTRFAFHFASNGGADRRAGERRRCGRRPRRT